MTGGSGAMPRHRFFSVYSVPEGAEITYQLFLERTTETSITPDIPTREEHQIFFDSKPYKAWYLVQMPEAGFVGAVCLTKSNEIGVFIFKESQGRGYGPMAVRSLMACHPEAKYTANINPRNERSIRMFEKLGFKHIQNTYALERSEA